MASLATNDDDDNNNNIPTKESIIENIKALIDDEQLLLAVEKLKLLKDKEIELSKNNNYIRFAKQCKEELNTFLTQLSPIDTSTSSDWVAVSEETEKYRVWYKQKRNLILYFPC